MTVGTGEEAKKMMEDRQRTNSSYTGVGGLTGAIKAEESFREITRSPDQS